MSNKVHLKKKRPHGANPQAQFREPTRQRSFIEQTIQTALYFHQSGNFQQAEEYYLQALAADPNNPSANNLLGTLYYQSGDLAAAAPLVEKAIQAQPYFVEAHNLLGSIHHALGHYEKAIISYRKVLDYQPDYAMAHNNLGIALMDIGQFRAALDSYQRALEIQPGYVDAYANRGIAYRHLGQIDDAIASYGHALLLRPDFVGAYPNFSSLMILCKILPASISSASDRKKLLINCLNRNDLQSQNFFHASFNELFWGDTLAEAQKFISAGENSEVYRHFINESSLSNLFSEQLFLLMLRKTIIADPFAEKFLTSLRKGLAMLLATKELDEQFYRWMTPLVCAMAQQCFWNEYVFQTTVGEAEFLSEINAQLRVANSLTTQKSIVYLALLACYAPLYNHAPAENIPENPATNDRDFSELIRIQLFEPRKEKKLSAEIRSFSEISDEISQLVKQQYEENPYPRWTGFSMIPSTPFSDWLRQEIAPNSPDDLPTSERPEVLIAGGGTGRQPIGCAATYRNSSVVAIDLSLASLAYAKRKADELGITNIEFIEGDILALHKLGKTFDIIECSGVLHHMSDPKKGLEILVDLLRPSGYLQIGLYSEFARQHIVAAREYVKDHAFAPTVKGIRDCRQALFALPDDEHAKLVTIGQDFYATSTVRDLIFHVQEHRYTLPQISELLEELNLEFLGFAIGMGVKNAYLAEHGDDPGAISLVNWHLYEQKNPGTFFGMYNFWVRKKPPLGS
jgi:tetratricopeptide (TPR) repeat protein